MENHWRLNLAASHTVWPILICVLGNFRVLKSGQSLTLRNAGKTQALLTSLAVAPHQALSRDAVLEAVWPDVLLDLAANSLCPAK